MLNYCPSKIFGRSHSQAGIQLFFQHPLLPPLAQQSPSARDYPVGTVFCVSLIRLLFNSAWKLLQMNLADIPCWYINRKTGRKVLLDKGVDENVFPHRLVKNKIIFIDVSNKRSSSKYPLLYFPLSSLLFWIHINIHQQILVIQAPSTDEAVLAFPACFASVL